MKTDINLLSFLLPSGLFDYFELVDIHDTAKELHFFLDERNTPPTDSEYTSKGFTEQRVIQDFPIRGKSVYLHIRRRKWLNISTNEIITSNYDLTALGTQISEEFAAF